MHFYQKYSEKELIGRGNFGKVYLIYDNKTLQPFVAKKISLQGLSQDQVQKTMRQIQIHKGLQHENIIAFKEYFLEQSILIIIMEYCEYGDLLVYIKKYKQKNELLEEELIMNWFIQIVQGLQYLHNNKIIHRDIKPQNIFINDEGVLKLADFGISKAMQHTHQRAMTLVGTPFYLSPEACKNEGYTGKSDIWSLGCVLYELCALHHPFQGSNVLSLASKITNDPVPNIPSVYSEKMFNLIKWLLAKDPQRRPTSRQMLENSYVKLYNMSFSQVYDSVPPKSPSKQKSLQNQNQFRPQITTTYYHNQFLQDQQFHPKKPLSSPNKKTSLSQQILISPNKRTQKLKQKCVKKMGEEQFQEIYGIMRKMKSQGNSQIEIQRHVKKICKSKGDFDAAMDIAQLIYVEDNP